MMCLLISKSHLIHLLAYPDHEQQQSLFYFPYANDDDFHVQQLPASHSFLTILINLNIPDTVAYIGEFCFAGCDNKTTGDNGNNEDPGDLIIYSPNSDALVDVAYTFGELTGIHVEVQSLGTGEALEKIVAEAENPQADVLYGGVNYANAFKYADYFEGVSAGDG